MVRRALTIATLVAVLIPGTASALSLEQIKAQGANAADDLALSLGISLASNSGLDVQVTGSATECKKTSRSQGLCIIDAEDAESGAWCTGTAVIRQSGKRLLRSARNVECGDVTAD